MRYTIRRYMDDGYGSTHLIEEYYTDDTFLVNSAIKEWEEDPSFIDICESFHVCDYKEVTDSSNFNPNGSGNNVDELRIFDGDDMVYVIG